MIQRLNSADAAFDQQLSQLLAWEAVLDAQLQDTVQSILASVRSEGDAALLRYTNQFDQRSVVEIQELFISRAQMQAASERISAERWQALQVAQQRIQMYHEHQLGESWQISDEYGSVLGQKVSPIARAGVYVPGGKASYPSSVLMNVVPAKVAGVGHITMVVPAPAGELNDMVLAAAFLAGVDELITVGGAQAVAALAYGTASLTKVDKIVGPGNRFVAEAKRQVYGSVGLDMIAGPSEILIVCDGKTPADWIAMDLFSQAEHDELAQAILLSPSASYLDEVEAAIARLLPGQSRREIIAKALKDRGALVQVASIDEAIDLVNRIAPEHLELSLDEPEQYLDAIAHAGAIFMGRNTPEAFGDYCAGPNHVLPTASTARFSSPLGVYDFQKRSSIINCSAAGAKALAQTASVLAHSESLSAHARSAEYRAESD